MITGLHKVHLLSNSTVANQFIIMFIQDSIDALMESHACPNCSYPVLPSHKTGCPYEDCTSHGVRDVHLAEETIQSSHHHLQEMKSCRKEQNISFYLK